MKPLTCAAARRRLDAFADGELPIGEQIAVSAHLEWCDDCAAQLGGLQTVGATLRAMAPGRAALSSADAAGFSTAMVSRLHAERDASIGAQIRLMFDDLHLVYAGLSATVATTACLIVMMGMLRFAADHRPDSLAGILSLMATPFECETISEVPAAIACRARWVERFQRATESAEQDAVFTLNAVIVHDGRLANLAVLRANPRADSSGQAEVIEELLDTVSRARSAATPTELSGTMVRFVARETVRSAKPPASDLTRPPSKESTSRTARARRVAIV
jgi:hypothetical protein